MRKVVVIMSVDWEPDHGRWSLPGREATYGGIVKGTPAFCRALDELAVPCTWFIEASQEPDRNLPTLFPQTVRDLAARRQDEIGLHLHWRRHDGNGRLYYETADSGWVSEQLRFGVEQLTPFRAPLSFRSGAFLYVADLPRLLTERSFTTDSSTLWGRSNRLKQDRTAERRKSIPQRVAGMGRRVMGLPPLPYRAHEGSVERAGDSGIVEFPVYQNVFDPLSRPHALMDQIDIERARKTHSDVCIVLFLHIDEIMQPPAPTAEEHELDPAALAYLQSYLLCLKRIPGSVFATFSQALSLLSERGAA
jgi:hypothetical protein